MLRAILLLIILVALISCSTVPQKAEPLKASATQLREFREAEALYRAKKAPTALKKFQNFIQRYNGSELSDDAAYYCGQIYYEQGDYTKAAQMWMTIVESPVASQLYERALLGAATSQSQMGQYEEALTLINKFNLQKTSDPNIGASILELSAKLRLQRGDALGATRDLMTAIEYKTQPADKQVLFGKAVEVVNGNLNNSQLEEVLDSSTFQLLHLYARYRLATLLYDQKSWPYARRHFISLIEQYPNTEQARRAEQYLSTIDQQQKVEPTNIGVVLPLSGKNAQTGYKVLKGIQLGLGIYNKTSASPIKLAIIDSEGNPDVARRGVERLVSEDHVIAIIGDMVSKTAVAVATKAQELGVPCLTLSQKQELTQIGDFIFRNTLTPEMQMRALVDYSMRVKGYRNFAIIFPNDSYGTEYATAFWDQVLLRGGKITAAQPYAPDETDFRHVVQRLVGTFYEEDRAKELKMRQAQWQKEQPSKTAREKEPRDLLPPIVDFDAIFIPDSPKTLGQIAPMLAYNDVSNVPLLGTNLWNSNQLVSRAAKFVENSLFVDDYFGEDRNSSAKKFSSHFQSSFGYKPDLFEALGFDAAAVILDGLKSSGFSASRVAFRDKLALSAEATGASGALKMSPQREVEKTLVPLTVTKGQIVKLEAGAEAPR